MIIRPQAILEPRWVSPKPAQRTPEGDPAPRAASSTSPLLAGSSSRDPVKVEIMFTLDLTNQFTPA